jgi:hypothetical protein
LYAKVALQQRPPFRAVRTLASLLKQRTTLRFDQSMKSTVRLAGALLLALGASTVTVRANAHNQSKYLYVSNIELKPGHGDQLARPDRESLGSHFVAWTNEVRF